MGSYKLSKHFLNSIHHDLIADSQPNRVMINLFQHLFIRISKYQLAARHITVFIDILRRHSAIQSRSLIYATGSTGDWPIECPLKQPLLAITEAAATATIQ